MAYITHRKHAAGALPYRLTPTTAALALLALPVAVAAQTAASEAPAAAASSVSAPTASPKAETLPAIKVKAAAAAAAEDGYKATTVSSPKFTQPLLDTPQTITVIKKELLRDQGKSSLSEALSNTPGITFTMGENGNTTTGDSIFMRGFDTSGAIFVDGIRDLGTISRDTFNTEQIEVVKGPSGADNGRGSPTGYINLSSKVATAESFSNGGVQVGSGNRLRATADLNRTLDVLPGAAFRLNVMSDQGDTLGRDVVKTRRWGIAPSLALGLGTPTRAFFNYLHLRQTNIPDGGLPTIGLAGFTNPNPITAGAPRVDSSNFYGALTDYDHSQADSFTARLEHDLTPVTKLRNTSRFSRTTQQYTLTGTHINSTASATALAGLVTPNPADINTWQVLRTRQGKDQQNQLLTNQTNLTTTVMTSSVKHTVSTGLEFLYESQNNRGFVASGTASPYANLYAPSVNDSFTSVVPSGAYTKGNTTTVALYAFDTLEFTPQWQLSTGVRWDKYSTETVILPASTVALQTASLLGNSGDALTGKLAVVYKPVSTGSIYLAYATSEKPPGSDNFALNAPPSGTATTSNINNPNLEPQRATNLELGTKWDLLDNTLVVTAAAFRTTNSNDLASRDAVTGEVTQFGKKQVRGIELGTSGQLSPAWQVSAGLALMDTEVSQGTSAQTGAAINYSPKVTFTSWTTYKLPMGLTFGGGARYVDSQSTAVSNGSTVTTGLPQIPSYWVADLMAAYTLNKNATLQLNLTNVADAAYIASVNNGRSRYTVGAPRAVSLSANVQF